MTVNFLVEGGIVRLYLTRTEQVVEQLLLVKQVRSYTDDDDTVAMMSYDNNQENILEYPPFCHLYFKMTR